MKAGKSNTSAVAGVELDEAISSHVRVRTWLLVSGLRML